MPSYLLSVYKANTRLRIDWPFAEYGHMVQETPCWMENDAEGQEIQRDYIIQKAKIISFQVPTASFLCHSKRCFLYHVAIFCKGPTEFPKKMVLFCYFRLYFRHWNCFLSSVARDGHGLKLGKVGQTFSSEILCLQKSPKELLFSALWWNLFDIFRHSNDFGTEMT